MAKAKRRQQPVLRSRAQGNKAATNTTTTPIKTGPLEVKLNSIVSNENPSQNFENVTVVHGSPSTKTPEAGLSLNCTVCARQITSQTPVTADDETTFQLLFPLFKLLKISPAVCRFVLKHSSQPVGYCEPCRNTISNGLRISKEIEILQNSLEAITSRVKDDFLEGYYCRARDANEKFSIRKALVQCWTTCRVKINRIERENMDTYVGTRRNPKIDFKSKSQITPAKMKESQHSSHDLTTDLLANAGFKTEETDPASDIDFDLNEDSAPRSPSPIVSDVTDHLDDRVEREENVSETESVSVPPPVRPSPVAKKSKAKKKTPRKIKKEVALLADFQDSKSVLDSGEIPIEGSNWVFETEPSKFEEDPAEDHDPLLPSSVDPGADVTENISGNDIEEKESGFICRRSLRRRPQKEIPTYLIEIESDGNVSESGSVYSPDSPLPNHEDVQGPHERQKNRKSPRSHIKPRNQTNVTKFHKTSSSNSLSQPTRRYSNEKSTILKINSAQKSVKFPYRCKICGKGYYKQYNLKIHEKYHQQGHEEFPCDLCGKSFLSNSQLNMHFVKGHPEEWQRRPKDKSDADKTTRRSKKPPLPFNCKTCGRGYQKLPSLRVHERSHQPRRTQFPCDQCEGKSFSSAAKLQRHTYSCHKELWRKQWQVDEKLGSSQEFLYRCKTCGKGYQSFYAFQMHEKSHEENIERFPCTLCEGKKTFISLHYLNVHIAGVHKSGALQPDDTSLLESFECSYCSKVYRRKDFIDETNGRLRIVCDSDGCKVRWTKLLEYSFHHGLTCPKKLELAKEDVTIPFPGEGEENTDGIKRIYCEPPPGNDAPSADGTTSSNTAKPVLTRCRNRRSYTCKLCGKSGFTKIDDLSQHKNRHHGVKSISCPECDEKFVITKTAIQHQIMTHGKPVTDVFGDDGSLESFQCVFCLQSFSKEEYLVDDPTSTGTEDEPPKKILKIFVGFCKIPLTDLKDFQWHHLRTCRSRLRLDFGDGEKEQYYSADLQEKKIDSVGVDVNQVAFSHRCDICEKTYDVKFGIDYSGKRWFICPMEGCTKRTYSRRNFRYHHVSHHPESGLSSFNCEPCGKVFCETVENNCNLTYKSGVKYKCELDECQSTFGNFKTFRQHHRAHHSERGVVPKKPCISVTLCKYCGKSYLHKEAARNHEINKHTKLFKCYCEICGLGMASATKLKEHLQAHSTERPFKCELCPRSFKVLFQLKEHMNFHNDVKPYICEICGKSFHFYNTLGMHRRAHQKKEQQ